MKRWLIIVVMVSLVLAISPIWAGSCAPKQEVTAVSMVTLGTGTTIYPYDVAVADVLQRYTGLKVSVTPTGGPSPLIDAFRLKQADLSVFGSPFPVVAFIAAKGCEETFPEYVKMGRVPFRFLATGGDMLPFGILVRKDSGMHKVSDLKGKTIFGESPPSAAIFAVTKGYLNAVGLEPYKDVNIKKMDSTPEGVQALMEGKADGAVTTTRGAKIVEFDASVGGWFLDAPIDEKAMAIYNKNWPGQVPYTVEKDALCLPKGTHMFSQVISMFTHDGMSDELAYLITKTVLEHLDELGQIQPGFKDWELKRMSMDIGAAFHPGAIKYYKEKGLWSAERDKLQQQQLAEEAAAKKK